MFTYDSFFFFNDTATTEIYTLSLHDALPISPIVFLGGPDKAQVAILDEVQQGKAATLILLGDVDHQSEIGDDEKALGFLIACLDRKSTRLNSSHSQISYAVFCLKKKKIRRFCRDGRTSMLTGDGRVFRFTIYLLLHVHLRFLLLPTDRRRSFFITVPLHCCPVSQ